MQPVQREYLLLVVQKWMEDGAKADLKRWMQAIEISKIALAGLLLCADLEIAKKIIGCRAAASRRDLQPAEKMKETPGVLGERAVLLPSKRRWVSPSAETLNLSCRFCPIGSNLRSPMGPMGEVRGEGPPCRVYNRGADTVVVHARRLPRCPHPAVRRMDSWKCRTRSGARRFSLGNERELIVGYVCLRGRGRSRPNGERATLRAGGSRGGRPHRGSRFTQWHLCRQRPCA